MKPTGKRTVTVVLATVVLTLFICLHAEAYEKIQMRPVLTNGPPIYFRDSSRMPGPSELLPQAPASPACLTNFAGFQEELAFLDSVPDTHGAVGTNRLMTFLNPLNGIQTRAGQFLSTNLPFVFWRTNSERNIKDPRMAYDPYHHRWIAVAMSPDVSPLVLLGVSPGGDPSSTNWSIFYCTNHLSASLVPDSTTVGFHKDWIVVQAVLRIGSSNAQSSFYVFDKTNVYAGAATGPVAVLAHYGPGTVGGELPAWTYDNSQTNFYLLQNANGTNGCLRLFSIWNSNGVPVLAHTNVPLYIKREGVTWGDEPPGTNLNMAPQLGASVGINPGYDSRIQNVVYRNGSLWCAQTVILASPLRSAIQWWEINPRTSIIVQFGRIENQNGTNYAYPSIAVNRFNDVLIGHAVFASNIYASAAYSFRACTNTQNAMGAPYFYKAGLTNFVKDPDVNRWGDYSLTQVDPVNDTDFWTLQEYAAHLTSESGGQWGTWWANVCVDVPANDNFEAACTLSGGQGSTNGATIRATLESGEPDHGGNTNSPSVWYRWTAPANGNVSFAVTNYTGTSFDAVLAVYTGTSVAGLTLVTNHHGGAQVSSAVFNATSNTTYRIAVASMNGTRGSFVLAWNQPTAPLFTRHPEATNVVAGETVTFSASVIGVPQPTNQWRLQGTNLLGATNPTYTITNVQTNHMTNYMMVAGSSSGSATSLVAGLIVHDSAAATLSLWNYVSNQFMFHVYGVTNRGYTVEGSTNLANWTVLITNVVSFNYTNQVTTNYPYRFFRAVAQP